MARHVYTVEYKLYSADEVHKVDVLASNKIEAYDQAMWGDIPYRHDGDYAYSAWVASVTYQNGNYRRFNTHEGMPY